VDFTDRETGSNQKLISLGGVIGQAGLGREVNTTLLTMAVGVLQYALAANPKRISALIVNNGDVALASQYVGVYIGENNTGPFFLTEFGSFQIDENFPWTGSVYIAYLGAGSPVISITEVSVP
jgi:hypothetical protein